MNKNYNLFIGNFFPAGKKPFNENSHKKSLIAQRQPFSNIKGFVKDVTRRSHTKGSEIFGTHNEVGTSGLQSKKSDIEAVTKSLLNETSERKDKRGQLYKL